MLILDIINIKLSILEKVIDNSSNMLIKIVNRLLKRGKRNVISDNGNIIDETIGTKNILRNMLRTFIWLKLFIAMGTETIKDIKETINSLYSLFLLLFINWLKVIR